MRSRVPVVIVCALSCQVLFADQASQAPAGGSSVPLTAIRAGMLFDGTSEAVSRNVTILVRDGRIAEVGPNVNVPEDAARIDLTEWTVMPGFIDLHTHITGDPEDLSQPPGLFLYTDYPEYPAFKGVVNARKTLLAGFRTVVAGQGLSGPAVQQ